MVLFSEASTAQVEIIRDCLNRFCEALGQMISYSKLQVFFSINVNHDLVEEIAAKLNIERTEDLGKYLGVPSFHGRVTCRTFDDLLESES